MDIGPEQNGTWNSYSPACICYVLRYLLSPSAELLTLHRGACGLWLGWVGHRTQDTHLFCDAGNPRLMAAWAARARLNNSLAVSPHFGSGRDYPREMAASSHLSLTWASTPPRGYLSLHFMLQLRINFLKIQMYLYSLVFALSFHLFTFPVCPSHFHNLKSH